MIFRCAPAVLLLSLCGLLATAAAAHEVSKQQLIAELATAEGEYREHLVWDLKQRWQPAEDSRHVPLIRLLLSDFSGPTPGNTVAGEAAQILARDPNHVLAALAELLDLIATDGYYHYPQQDAGRAVLVPPRRVFEAHFMAMSSEARADYAERIAVVLEAERGNFIGLDAACRLAAMVPENRGRTLAALDDTIAFLEALNATEYYPRRALVRCRWARNIHRIGRAPGDPVYDMMMDHARLEIVVENARWYCRRDYADTETKALADCISRVAEQMEPFFQD